jgi:hypothetical protein
MSIKSILSISSIGHPLPKKSRLTKNAPPIIRNSFTGKMIPASIRM